MLSVTRNSPKEIVWTSASTSAHQARSVLVNHGVALWSMDLGIRFDHLAADKTNVDAIWLV